MSQEARCIGCSKVLHPSETMIEPRDLCYDCCERIEKAEEWRNNLIKSRIEEVK